MTPDPVASAPPFAVSTSRPRAEAQQPPGTRHGDSRYIPLALAAGGFALYLLTGTGFHTFDAAAYIRDMEKPLAAMVLPHHLVYEPLLLALYRLWQAAGGSGYADRPAEVLSSLAGAAGLAVFYNMAWEAGRARGAALLATLALAL